MKKASRISGKTGVIFSIILIVIIILVSIFFRLVSYNDMSKNLGQNYVDPETGVPYLTEMDSYVHLRMTKDIMSYGHPGQLMKDGRAWDVYKYAPEGTDVTNYKPLMAYIAVCSQKVLSLFTPISIDEVAYFLSIFLSALVIIPVFILTSRLKGRIAGAVAAVLSSINYGYFIHTVPGFYDTDNVIMWTSCFFFCFLCLFITECFEEKKEDEKKYIEIKKLKLRFTKKGLIFAILCLISFIILMYSWDAYTLFVAIAGAGLLVYTIIPLIFKKRFTVTENKKRILSAIGVILVMGILILILDFATITKAIDLIKMVFAGGKNSVAPDAYVSVAELRKPSLIAGGLTGLFQMKVLSESEIGIINAVGGIVPSGTAIAMIVLIIKRMVRGERKFAHVLLVIWFVVTAVLAFRGWRFIMLFAVPVAILSGMLVGEICKLMETKKMMDWKIFAGMIIILAIFPALYGAYRSSMDSSPIVNREFAKTVTAVRDYSPEDTLIAGWWDYGYFYEIKGERPTLFDGETQNSIRIYWISRALATDNECYSRNIIRMLAGEGDKATNRMFEIYGESYETLDLMNELLMADRATAKEKLIEKGLTEEEAGRLAEYFFPESDVPVTYIVTEDMARIATWYNAFGYHNGDYESAIEDYYVLADNINYIPEEQGNGWIMNKGNNKYSFFINGTADGYNTTMVQYVNNEEQPVAVEKIYEIDGQDIREYELEKSADDQTGFSVVIYKDGNNKYLSVMTTRLLNSVFGRMYYLNGQDMQYYKPAGYSDGSGTLYDVE